VAVFEVMCHVFRLQWSQESYEKFASRTGVRAKL
jgi:hypothetical protein